MHVPNASEVFEPDFMPASAAEARFGATAHATRASTLSSSIDEMVAQGLAPTTAQVEEAADAQLAADMLDGWCAALTA